MLEFTNKERIKKKGHMTNPEPGNERKIANCPWLSMLISSCRQLWFCRGIFYHPGKQNIKSGVCLQDERQTLSLEEQLVFRVGLSTGERPVTRVSQCLVLGKSNTTSFCSVTGWHGVSPELGGHQGSNGAEIASLDTAPLKAARNQGIFYGGFFVSHLKIHFCPR